MKNNLINDINNYINYLNAKGLSVSVHGKTISGLIENNIHKNSYCTFIKTRDEAWKQCVKCQQKVLKAYNNDYRGQMYIHLHDWPRFFLKTCVLRSPKAHRRGQQFQSQITN